ncbi:MAG: M23 family metallopeptidase [Bacteroidota bacterium]
MNEQNIDIVKKARKTDWWLYSIPVLIVLTIAFYLYIHSRPGNLGIIAYYLAPAIITFFSVVFLIIGIIRSIIRRPFFSIRRLAGFALLLLLCFSGSIYSKYPSSFDHYKSKVAFRLPLDTALTVAWGGGSEDLNYHVTYPNQCWAYDMMVVKDGSSHSGNGNKLEDYYAYGLAVLSPAAGKVVKVVDSFPDMKIGVLGGGGINNPEGNHVIIEVAQKEYLVICHLKPKSVMVKVGDILQQGQTLALVGNSGNTSEPHIHIHLQSSTDDFLSEGIPLYFHNYTSNGKFVAQGIPTGGISKDGHWDGETIRHVQQ